MPSTSKGWQEMRASTESSLAAKPKKGGMPDRDRKWITREVLYRRVLWRTRFKSVGVFKLRWWNKNISPAVVAE